MDNSSPGYNTRQGFGTSGSTCLTCTGKRAIATTTSTA
jgi:hypothetical protein